MDLTLKETASLLKLSESEVRKLVRDRKLRAYKIYSQYRFNRDELNEWILKGRVPVSDDVLSLVQSSIPVNMYKLFSRGGVFYDIEGKTPSEVIPNAVNRITTPPDIDRETIIASLLEREDMMTTGMGNGIALPHPRNPIIANVEFESISICFLKNDVDFGSIDDKPVHTLFIILSANARHHLEVLSKVSYLCSNPVFLNLLANKADSQEIMNAIEAQEHVWRRKK